MTDARHLYVHVPFCVRRCTYCDFSIAVRARTPVREYLDALRLELDLRYPTGSELPLDTLYLGGGTPSRLGPDGLAELLSLVRERFTVAPDAEVTIEANPDDVSPEAAAAWPASGINRVSLGVQSFDDRVLRWMHRAHDARAARTAIAALRAAGVENLSIDLIFALPESLERDFGRDLEEVIALDVSHVSLYGLTVEKGTPLDRWRARGDVIDAPEENYESEFLLARQLLTRAGFDHYEVSNFARPGRRSRHNSAYWRRVPYAAIGPSAHSFDGVERRWAIRPYAEWRATLAAGSDPTGGSERLDDEQIESELTYLGLRTDRGLPVSPDDRPEISRWIEAGWATETGGVVRLTASGWLRLDALAARLTALRSRSYI